MPVSSRVRACDFGVGPGSDFKIRPFYNSVGMYAGTNKGSLKGYILHPPSFCEVGYANFRPNVFAAGQRISTEILVGVGLHARCPVASKGFVAFSKNANVQERYLSFM